MRALIAAFLLLPLPVQATDAPYAGQQTRSISSFSAEDIAALKAGEGWGLALPAELNGWPGPLHVLEMSEALDLSADQTADIEAIFATMRSDAQEAGQRLLKAEATLDAAFETDEIDGETLAELLVVAATARAALREVHLAAHLETAPLLTRHQKMLYDQARGYADGAAHHGHSGHATHGGAH